MAGRTHLLVVLTPVADRGQGDYIYRVRQPFSALAQAAPEFRVASISNVLPNKEMLLLAADLVIIRMVADADLIAIAWERKQAQRPTIFEIADDFLGIPKSNPAAGYYRRPETRAILFQLIPQCDLVQVTTRALKRKYQTVHPRIEVFENQLAALPPLTPKPAELTVGWAGSDGHFEDVQSVAPALVQWLRNHPELRLALKCSRRIRDLFRGLPAGQLRVEEPGSLESYFDFLSTIHIGLAPLEDNDYNRCRSDVKYLEYASSGVAPVCADLEPYRSIIEGGRTGLTFRTPDELLSRLNDLINDPQKRQEMVDRGRRRIRQERLEAQHVGRRAEIYQELIGQWPEGESRVKLQRWGLQEVSSGFFEESQLPEVAALLEGMGRRDPEGSLPFFARAIEINPNYDRPFLCAGIAMARRDPERARRYLDHSLALNPSGVYARLLLGDLLAGAGRVADAAETYATAWNQCPAYVDPLVRLARMCDEAGEEERAHRHLKMAAEICPHHPAVQDLDVGMGNHAEEGDEPDAA